MRGLSWQSRGKARPIGQSKRNQAWAATEVLDEVDRLNQRLADIAKEA
jgi:hypothetical protein